MGGRTEAAKRDPVVRRAVHSKVLGDLFSQRQKTRVQIARFLVGRLGNRLTHEIEEDAGLRDRQQLGGKDVATEAEQVRLSAAAVASNSCMLA